MLIVHDALRADLPHAEKLVMVYLAATANDVGVGFWQREQLSEALKYKPRSIQRILKSLRDQGYLTDFGPWYRLALSDRASEADMEQLPEDACCPEMDKMLDHALTQQQHEIDAERVGRRAAMFIEDVAGEFLDQLQNFELRLDQRMAQMATFHVEPEPPPPDPVKESEHYQGMISMGIDETIAYEAAAKSLELLDAVAPESAQDAPEVPEAQVPERHFEDTQEGRLQRVADILAGGHPYVVGAGIKAQWGDLERSENKHTVKGEVDAFELLYPAIVTAARERVGTPLATFLDPIAIERGLAPWDLDPNPNPMESEELQADVDRMLAELAQHPDPRNEVQPRVVETGADGVQRTETIVRYHRRVLSVYEQMRDLVAQRVMT